MQFVVTDDGSLDLIFDGIDFTLVDEDLAPFFADDVLAAFTHGYSFTLHPDDFLVFTVPIDVTAARLNAADDFFEGSFLELAGSGVLAYHDANGARTVAFDLKIPEPTTAVPVALGLGCVVGLRRRIGNAVCVTGLEPREH